MHQNLLEIYYSFIVSEDPGCRIIIRYGQDAQIGQQLRSVKYRNDDVHLVDGTEIVRAIENVPKLT